MEDKKHRNSLERPLNFYTRKDNAILAEKSKIKL